MVPSDNLYDVDAIEGLNLHRLERSLPRRLDAKLPVLVAPHREHLPLLLRWGDWVVAWGRFQLFNMWCGVWEG